MKNSASQITETQRKKNLLTYVIIVTLACLYGGLRMGFFMATSDDATLISAFAEFMNKWTDKPWQLFPTNFICIGIFLAIGAVIDVVLYNKYLISKDTVEFAHGDARFEKDYDEYEREFVIDPQVVEEFTGKKMTDRNCPRNDEGKKVYKGIKKTQGDKVKKLDVIEECRRRSMIYTDKIYLSLNNSWCQRNSNSIVFGASGAGKSRYFLEPNVLQANGSIVCTDPSGEVMQATGYFLKEIQGYDVKCFNIENMTKSCRFNPLHYIRSTKDIAMIVDIFLQNIGSENKSSSGDGDFWTQSAKALMCAVIGYQYEVLPIEQRNLSNTLDIIRMDRRSENDDANVETAFDVMFQNLGAANPSSYAYQQYLIFKQAPAKTRLNIIISTSVNLSQMDIPEIKNLTCKDELHLDEVGQRKMAIFLVIPQSNKTFKWLPAMFYSLLFELLYEYGYNRREKGSSSGMEVPVQVFVDECANIGKIPNLSERLATCRKYRISIVPIFQTYSQIEELYGKEGANSIISNCDAFLFLGSSDEATVKLMQGHLGKETVKILSHSMAQTTKGSNSASKQQVGKELMTRDQIETMSNSECLLFIRSLRTFKTKKYNLERHPNFKYFNKGECGKNFDNPFTIEYEDDEIENNRVKQPDEDGYIAPVIVDSARRRNLINTNLKKAKEVREIIDELENEYVQASDDDKQTIGKQLDAARAELKKLESTDPNKNGENTLRKKAGMELIECDETKSESQYKQDLENNEIQTNGSLDDVVDIEPVGGDAPIYEFE